MITSTNHPYSPEKISQAYKAFIARYPAYRDTTLLDDLRQCEYGRLDEQNQIYLDYTGGGLHAESQIRQHMELLTTYVFGNPHSLNPTSLAMTELVEHARAYVLEFFNAPPDEYLAIFTSNATGALKLVGESYPFSVGGRYVLSFDNHNSVNGIREYAKARGAQVTYVPVTAPDLRIDQNALEEILNTIDPAHNNLFAFPAQSNFSGVQHPMENIALARERGWDVFVDCAAFAPTNQLDIDLWKPDFAAFSFYKIFGYPTGLGCLLGRKEKLDKLKRPWFSGGTIKIASVQGDGYYLHENEAAFEDGTVDYLNIPAVETGLRHIQNVGISTIHKRVICLTGWLLDQLLELHHDNGRPLVRVHGPRTTDKRGATLALSLYDENGLTIDDQRIVELANKKNISLRNGCFCNPGAGEVSHGLTSQEMNTFFEEDHPVSFAELRQILQKRFQKNVSAVRVSTGIASNFSDVYQLMNFISGFINKTAVELGAPADEQASEHMWRDTA